VTSVPSIESDDADELLDAPVDGDEPSPVGKRSRRWRRLAILASVCILLLGGITVAAWKLPPWMIARARKLHVDCSNANYGEHPGASLACEGAFHQSLDIAKISPWTRDEARQLELEWTADELDGRLALATEVLLDRAMQDEAADELVAWMAQPGFPSDRRTTDWAFSMIAQTGNRAQMVRHAAHASDGFGHARAWRAAIVDGELEAATRLAGSGESDDYGHELERGAWLCLVGDSQAGLLALENAEQHYREAVGSPYVEAWMGMLACGGRPVVDETPFPREPWWAVEVMVRPDPEQSLERLHPRSRAKERAGDWASPFFADWLAAAEREPLDLVAGAAGLRSIALAETTTPWSFSGPSVGLLSGDALVFDPVRHEAAARRVDALLLRVERDKLRIAPRKRRGDDVDPDQREWEERSATPAETLRKASTILWLELASARAQMFDAQGVARALAKIPAEELPPALALPLASYLFRAGDRAGARARLQLALALPEGRVRLDAELFVAMLELAEARPREALAAARRAGALAPAGSAEMAAHPLADTLGAEVNDSMRRAIGWVEAAAALAADEAQVETTVAMPGYYDAPGLPRDWFALARADAEIRKTARFRMHDVMMGAGEQAVLPAVIFVLHAVGHDGKDPEVFVDAMLPFYDPQLHGVKGLRARAEAARMRGDAAATALWDGRAEALEALFSTPERVLLARLAGLE